jgi:hypothetical protein
MVCQDLIINPLCTLHNYVPLYLVYWGKWLGLTLGTHWSWALADNSGFLFSAFVSDMYTEVMCGIFYYDIVLALKNFRHWSISDFHFFFQISDFFLLDLQFLFSEGSTQTLFLSVTNSLLYG